MNRTTRLSWILLILLIPITSFSQNGTSGSSADPANTEIVYTGRLLGYFRVPSLQPDTLRTCPATSDNDSEAAKRFKEFRKKHANSVLLGTGDNFAPQLEARVFSFLDAHTQHDKYHPANKELHFFDTLQNKWEHIDNIDPKMKDILAQGNGTIPTDNVGCFLAAAGYAAVVPGRHDFYFGAERVRQLARLMAQLKPEYGNRSPQMLGANLVLKTTPVDPGDPVSDKGKPEWMETDWPKEYSLLNLPKTVYPWFQAFKIKISGDDSTQFKTRGDEFRKARFYVCKSNGSPNEIAKPGSELNQIAKPGSKPPEKCQELKPEPSGDPKPTSVEYKLPIVKKAHEGEKGHFSTLTPNKNYALCLVRAGQKKDGPSEEIVCQRFSVHVPFFYFPQDVPTVGKYTDPDPFVFIDKKEGVQPNEVAIFGVVDQQLGEHVGVLNFAWKNNSDDYKSIVSVEDPEQALREQLDYFERWYKDKSRSDKGFQGLKILLAQMSPERARRLAARFPGFQIVVAGADGEQTTTEVTQTIEWSSKNSASAFVAVPAPYFSTEQQAGVLNPGFVKAKPKDDRWTLESDTTYHQTKKDEEKKITEVGREGSINHRLEVKTKNDFDSAVDRELKKCLPIKFEKLLPQELPDRLKLVTLCAMREHVNADLAIVQKRDFFTNLPDRAPEVHVQQYLDRFVWKGDLLTVMLVPGKSIKEALKHSSKVDAEEKAVLTLESEKGRGFEQVGARHDPDRDQYLINEVPIDDAKIYTVVTTDYLSTGDTGYPELVASAWTPRKEPGDFPKELETISSIVCRKLFPDSVRSTCLPNIPRDKYLDTIAALPPPPSEQRGAVKKFFRLSPFGLPDKSKEPETAAEALQRETERRPIWTLSLRKLSFGFTTLKNNMTDAQVDDQFGGIPTSGVTAHTNRGVTVKLETRSAISYHQHELFLEGGIDYQDTSKGRANDAPEFDQITNRVTVDPGWLWRLPGRSKPHFAAVFSLHLETPFKRPIETFFLSTKTVIDPVNNISKTDRLVISQERGFLVLPRVGVRWQNRDTTYFEVGYQRGKEYDAFAGYEFFTGSNPVPEKCVPNAKDTIVKCIQDKSNPANPSITKDSIATAILTNRPRAGLYWKSNFTLPLGPKVKYEFSDEGDFFFKRFDADLVTDTRFRDNSKHSLKFSVWPSLSFGPALNLLLYQNKINKNWLTQKQFTLETTINFDFFNRREKSVQLRNKP